MDLRIYSLPWIYIVDGISMNPALQPNDILLVRKLPAPSPDLHRGDIVIANGPGSTNQYYVKRVVGMPGELLVLEDGLLLINGERLHETYLHGLPAYLGTESYSWQMDGDHYFLMGDNRAHSTDSRDYGPVASIAIIGRVSRRIWPPHRWRSFWRSVGQTER
ncbi:MAG: signal peptidase I [Chloroflexi bacterium]|nr:signal peptidase I [Chloroflexota bacterium]